MNAQSRRHRVRCVRRNSPERTERVLPLTELRTACGALNTVASPPTANEFEEVGKEGGIQNPLWEQTTNDWWLVAHLSFFKSRTSLLLSPHQRAGKEALDSGGEVQMSFRGGSKRRLSRLS